jgi:hypothetical protein
MSEPVIYVALGIRVVVDERVPPGTAYIYVADAVSTLNDPESTEDEKRAAEKRIGRITGV